MHLKPGNQLLLLGVALLAGLVDLPRNAVGFGSISGLGVVTLAECGAVWMAYLAPPARPARRLLLLPLALFSFWTVGSLLWTSVPVPGAGVQNLLVFLTFLGLIVLTAREVELDPQFGLLLERCIAGSALLGAAIFAACWVTGAAGDDRLLGTRAFGLFALLGIACFLARWRWGDRWCLGAAALLAALVFLSMSRMAFVAGMLLFPLAVLLRGGRRAIIVATATTVLIGGALGVAIFLYQPMYDRFFGYDTSFDVGGVAINASGRAGVWETIYDSFREQPWTGHGVGSTSRFTDVPGMGHPHNDYLLLAHDYGLLGLGLWLAGTGAIALRLRRGLLGSGRDDPRGAAHLAALLGLAAVSLAMLTDNPATYIYVMAPLGLLLGAALGTQPRSACES